MKEVLHLQLKILTPTFIGNGNKLLPIEVYSDGRTVKVFKFENLTRQVADIFPPEKVKNVMIKLSREVIRERKLKPLKEILEDLGLNVEDLKPDYTLPVERSFQTAEVEEFIKTLKGVYIPGSEIKGAFRTAIFYHILTTYDRVWEQFVKELKWFLKNYNPKSLKPFAQHWENKIFAGKPLTEPFGGKESPKGTKDILKFLQVGDSEVKNPSEVLVLKSFHLKRSKRKLTVWVESLKENSSFRFGIRWNVEGTNRFMETYLTGWEQELKEFWETLNEEKLLKILDKFTRDLTSFEEEKRREAIKERIFSSENGIKPLERLKKEDGYLLRLGKYIGRYSHSILLAVYKKDKEFFETQLKKRFHSKTYWEDEKGNPLGFCKIEFS